MSGHGNQNPWDDTDHLANVNYRPNDDSPDAVPFDDTKLKGPLINVDPEALKKALQEK